MNCRQLTSAIDNIFALDDVVFNEIALKRLAAGSPLQHMGYLDFEPSCAFGFLGHLENLFKRRRFRGHRIRFRQLFVQKEQDQDSDQVVNSDRNGGVRDCFG